MIAVSTKMCGIFAYNKWINSGHADEMYKSLSFSDIILNNMSYADVIKATKKSNVFAGGSISSKYQHLFQISSYRYQAKNRNEV
jgi:hypothetical protein